MLRCRGAPGNVLTWPSTAVSPIAEGPLRQCATRHRSGCLRHGRCRGRGVAALPTRGAAAATAAAATRAGGERRAYHPLLGPVLQSADRRGRQEVEGGDDRSGDAGAAESRTPPSSASRRRVEGRARQPRDAAPAVVLARDQGVGAHAVGAALPLRAHHPVDHQQSDKPIAYHVETRSTIPRIARSQGAIEHNAIALKPGETVERTECLWHKNQQLRVNAVEAMELT